MLPSLLHIRSGKKRLITLVWKKTITFGINDDSDIIIHNSHFFQHNATLGHCSSNKEITKQEKIAFSSPLKIHKLRMDGLNAHLFQTHAVYIFFFIIAVGLLAIGITKAINISPSNHQDWSPIALPAQDVYGYCRQDKNHSKGINFTFKAEDVMPHRLYFIAGGRGDGAKITFILNGTAMDVPFELPKGWGKETSIDLPASIIFVGENNLKLYITNQSSEQPSWGISSVRTSPISQLNYFLPDTDTFKPEQILHALKEFDLEPRQLAEFHMIISQWEPLKNVETPHVNKRQILNIIESRMKNILYQIAFDVRSKEMLSEKAGARQLLDDTANWIPEYWVEGKRIYDEINR